MYLVNGNGCKKMKKSIETAISESCTIVQAKREKERLLTIISTLSKKEDNFVGKHFSREIYEMRFKMMYGTVLNICSQMNLQEITYFLTLKIFDDFVSKYPISTILEVECTFFCCLSLASKFAEDHTSYIDLSMIKSINPEYSKVDIVDLEKKILFATQFNFNNPTAFEIIKLLCECNSTYNCQSTKKSFNERGRENFFSKAKEVLIMVLLDFQEIKLTNIELGITIICFLRKLGGMVELIPSEIKNIFENETRFIEDIALKAIENIVFNINPNFYYE